MKKILTATSFLALLNGCAHFNTTQIDHRDDEATTVTTKASATTFLASKTALSNWKATQAENQQGAEVGQLDQSSDASNIVEAAVRAAVEAAK